MLDLLLDLRIFTAALVVLAVLTPVASWAATRRWPAWQGRVRVVFGLFGPLALLLWGIHNAVLAVVGFDSAFSLLIVVFGFAALGLGLGWWIRGGQKGVDS